MGKLILQSFLGIILFVGGIGVLCLFFWNINSSGSIIFLIGSLLLIAGGIFFFIKVGKSNNMFTGDMPPSVTTSTETKEPSQLEKNNALLGDWKKTNETKERLRMLELSGSAESDK